MECWYILSTAFNNFLTSGVQKAEVDIIEFGEDVVDKSRLYQLLLKCDSDKLPSEIFSIAENVAELCNDKVIHTILKFPCELLYRSNGIIEKVGIMGQDFELSSSQDTESVGSAMKLCFKSSVITLQELNEYLCILSFIKSICIKLCYRSCIQSRELKTIYRISDENSLCNYLSLLPDTFLEIFEDENSSVCVLITLRETATHEDAIIKLIIATDGNLNISSDSHIQILQSIALDKLGFRFTSEFDRSTVCTIRPAQHSNGTIDSLIIVYNMNSASSAILSLNSCIDILSSKYSEIFYKSLLDNHSYCVSASDSIVEIMRLMPHNILEEDIVPDELFKAQISEILTAWSV